MANANPFLAALNAGEFSPKMRGRVDFSRYPAGAEVLLNMQIDERGGIFRRAGTYYVAGVKDAAERSYMIDFVPRSTDAYIVEVFGEGFRFFRDQGQITVAAHSSAIANGTFATDLTSWTDVDAGSGVSAHSALHGGSMSLNGGGTANADIAGREQQVTIGVADQSTVHVLKFRVIGDYGPISVTPTDVTDGPAESTGATANGRGGEWATLRIGTSSGGEQILADTHFGKGYHCISFTPGTGTIYIRFQHRWRAKAIYIDDVSFHAAGALELTHTVAQADVADLDWASTNDLMYFTHEDYHPHVLKHRGERSWSWEQVGFVDGPYLNENTDSALTITASATTGFGVTLTASRALWKTTDVGRLVRESFVSGQKAWAIIVGYTSATVVTIDILRNIGFATSAEDNFSLGAWGGDQGFPKYVQMFKQRSIYAKNSAQPTTVWGSQVGVIDNMRPDTRYNITGVGQDSQIEDDDAWTFTLVEADEIVGLAAARDLVVLAANGEIPMTSTGAQITHLDVSASRQTTYGSNGTKPRAVNSVVVFAQRGGRRLLRMGFDIRLEGYAAEDLTILSEHITKSGIVKIVHAQEPNSIIYCLLENGTLAALTYHPEQQVAGWSRVEIGGSFGSRGAVVEDIATIPSTVDVGRDELWMIVKRTVDGSTVRYIEYLEKDWNLKDAVETCIYADSALQDDNWNQVTDDYLTLGSALDPDDEDLWVAGASLTMTATGHTPFASGDVGQYWLLRYEGQVVEVEITAFSSSSSVTVTLLTGVPEDMRAIALAEWLDPSAKVSSVSGLDHLEGQEVIALVDGAVQGPFTVASGAITLDEDGGCVTVGLQYEHRYKSLKLDAGGTIGTAVGKPKTFGDLVLDFYATGAVYIGDNFTTAKMTDARTREPLDAAGLADKLWKGEYPLSGKAEWQRDSRICLKGDNPLPCWLLTLAPEMQTQEMM